MTSHVKADLSARKQIWLAALKVQTRWTPFRRPQNDEILFLFLHQATGAKRAIAQTWESFRIVFQRQVKPSKVPRRLFQHVLCRLFETTTTKIRLKRHAQETQNSVLGLRTHRCLAIFPSQQKSDSRFSFLILPKFVKF